LVLLHGLFDTHKGWRNLPGRMQAAGHPVLTLDLPGHGTSDPAASFEAAVDQLAAQIPPGPLRLIGHSLGAALAVRLALRLGQRVERLVLSAPAGLGPRINADFTDGMIAADTPAALARTLALLDAGPVSAQALGAELDRLRAERAGHAALAGAAARAGFQQIDITGDLTRLTCPITVLFGTDDRILHWQDVAYLPPAAAIHLIRGAGHLPHHVVPDLFMSLILDGIKPSRRFAHA
jgi:pyruvate dehydrogenase E2 component (dihydrolipoamide acetyltransferase)